MSSPPRSSANGVSTGVIGTFAHAGSSIRATKPLFDPRQSLPLVEWRRRRQSPFERGGADTPRIAGGLPFTEEGIRHRIEEHQYASRRNVSAAGRDEVPAGECVGIVGITTLHAGHAEEV